MNLISLIGFAVLVGDAMHSGRPLAVGGFICVALGFKLLPGNTSPASGNTDSITTREQPNQRVKPRYPQGGTRA